MATLVSGTVEGVDLANFDLITLASGAATTDPSTYRLTDKSDPDTYIEFQGGGFTYSGDELTGGTISTFIVVDDDKETFRITALALDGAAVAEFLSKDDAQGFLAAAFNGSDVQTGTGFNDHLIGYAGNDKLLGGLKDDVLDGGADNDILDGDEGNDTLLGGAGDDLLFGDPGNDTLLGEDGNDTLFAGTGDDSMDGGAGADTYEVDSLKDVAKDSGADADADTVESSVAWILDDTIENLLLTGTQSINGTGNGSDNVLGGNTKNNTLDGLLGADTMRGGGGNDLYIVDDKNDVVDETVLGSGGIDGVRSSASEFTLGTNVEALTLVGTGNLNGTGNNIANVITVDESKDKSGNNLISGLGGHDSLAGGEGADTLDGGDGRDTLVGGLGNDVFIVDNILDKVVEQAEENSVDTVKSSVSYELGSFLNNLELLGNFDLSGAGNVESNHILGNSGNNVLSGDDEFDEFAFDKDDTLEGGEGDDTYIVWYASDKVIETGIGDYDIVKSVATFTLGANLEELVLFRTDIDPVDGTGNELDNKITGSENGNKLSGVGGNDSINGGIKDGNDTLDGGIGDDTMDGAAGDDVYFVDSLKDVVIDGSGVDEVRVSGTDLGLVKLHTNIEHYNFSQFSAGPIAFTGTTAANRIVGTTANDTLNGGAGNDTLNGGTGIDELNGAAGNDTYVMDVDLDQVNDTGNDTGDTVQTATQQIDLTLGNFKGVENAILTGVLHLNAIGTDAKNMLIGNSGDNLLRGALGNDTLFGNAGADLLEGDGGADSMSGGTGSDSYEVDSTGDKIFEAKDAGTDIVTSTISYVLGDNVEDLLLDGGDQNKAALNGKGNDLDNVIIGTDGNNLIDAWYGADVMQGLDGDDTYVVLGKEGELADQVLEEEGKGTDLVHAWTNIELLYDNVENVLLMGIADLEVVGNKLGNVLTGNKGANKLDGALGVDTMIGAAGDDIYTMDSLGDKIEEKSGGGGDEIIFALDTDDKSILDLRTHIEHYNFSKYEGDLQIVFTGDKVANRITGSSKGDILAGDVGNDTLDGSFSADTMTGGAGNDTYVIDNDKDFFSEKDANGKDTGGKDTIVSMFTAYTLMDPINNVENLTIGGFSNSNGTGNIAANVLTGNDFKNELLGLEGNDTIIGGEGADTLDGGLGNDSMAGGDGSDLYILDSKSDRVFESLFSAASNDTIQTKFTHVLVRGFENLILYGDADINGTGNVDVNEITGNDGNNKLDGKVNKNGGGDFLNGGKGDDTYYVHVDGKTGAITGVIADVVSEEVGGGNDTVIVDAKAKSYSIVPTGEVENLTLTGSLDSTADGNGFGNVILGNGGDNKLQGGAGDDSLDGGAGNDNLLGDSDNDTLNGGAGTDTLSGGLGNDTYIVDGKDVIQDKGIGSDIDTIQASISIDLNLAPLADIEGVRLTGGGGLSATGDGGDNLLVGNTGGNKLTGNGGDDTLQGGGGNDTLDGGPGNDIFLYTSKLDGKDVINGFDGDATGGQDVLDLDALFDSLAVDTELRDDRIALTDKGSSVEVRVDVDGNPANGAEFLVATLNKANAPDVITFGDGQDIVLGTLT
jgi:Ca2+-binding RTX toxin-like protein